jgi:hypothetical protein
MEDEMSELLAALTIFALLLLRLGIPLLMLILFSYIVYQLDARRQVAVASS